MTPGQRELALADLFYCGQVRLSAPKLSLCCPDSLSRKSY